MVTATISESDDQVVDIDLEAYHRIGIAKENDKKKKSRKTITRFLNRRYFKKGIQILIFQDYLKIPNGGLNLKKMKL